MIATDSKPWYQQFWPWFLISLPLSSVVMGVVMITLAVNGKDSLVRENWYKDGMAINQRLDKQKLALTLGIEAFITVDKDQKLLYVSTTNIDTNQQKELFVQLIHPTLEQKDKTLSLFLTPDNTYFTKLETVPEGYYYFLLSDSSEQWEMESSINFSNDIQHLTLIPKG